MNKPENEDVKKLVPYGLIVTKQWLKKQGISRHLIDNWVKSGQLKSIYSGVYKLPYSKLTWEGIICSLQRMKISSVPGGITAIQLNGYEHFVEMSDSKRIHLYGDPPPNWINSLIDSCKFVYHRDKQLNHGRYLVGHKYDSSNDKLENKDPLFSALRTSYDWWGRDDWPLTISTVERALFELLLDVPHNISFEYVDHIMEGLTTLSPRRLNRLIGICDSVKVRRLFLWFSERHNHPWFKKIDHGKYTIENGELGHGKRMLIKGGRLSKKYLITVPDNMKDKKSE